MAKNVNCKNLVDLYQHLERGKDVQRAYDLDLLDQLIPDLQLVAVQRHLQSNLLYCNLCIHLLRMHLFQDQMSQSQIPHQTLCRYYHCH